MAAVTLKGQRFKALFATMQADTSLWPALLVSAGALFLLSLFTFYPFWMTLTLAAFCGIIAYYHPPAGTLLAVLLAFPAIAYQSPLFAWLYLLIIALSLFEVFGNWQIISFLSIIICAPFAPGLLGLMGGFVQFGLTLGALYSGSKRSVYISIPAVFFILLLSTLWLAPNSAFMLTRPLEQVYGPALDTLSRNHLAEPNFFDLPSAGMQGLQNMASAETVFSVSPAMGKVFSNALKLLLEDAAILQLMAWTAVLFLIGLLPDRLKGPHRQAASGLVLFLIPLSHYFISSLYKIPFPAEIIVYTIVTILALYGLENYHIDLSRERLLTRREKTQKFGKLGVEDLGESEGPASMSEVGGYEDVKRELHDAIVAPLENKEAAVTYGLKPASGILLFGPPGTGKTMLMRALSKELNMGFYYVKSSELISSYMGESEKNLDELFKSARKTAPCILFFDEIDAIAKRRDAYTSDDFSPKVLSALLTEMDGFKKAGKPVIVIGATNVPDQLDPAILRPGRLDKLIFMPLPDKAAREAILRVHTSRLPLSPDVDFVKLASITERYSGADLAHVATEATRLAAREAVSKDTIIPVSQKHFLAVLKTVRPSTKLDALADYDKFRIDFERRSDAPEPEKPLAAVSWKEVVGLDDVRTVLTEALEMPLLHEDMMAEYQIKPYKGLLLFGPPGCGKTMIVRAASTSLKATFLGLSGADLGKLGPDAAVNLLHETFNRARESAPALIFIDEIESLTPTRHLLSSPILTQLLQEMDGAKELKNVMIVGATNKPSQMDAALLRPGRFDKILYIPPPDAEAREEIFKQNLSKVAPSINYSQAAEMTPGFSGADIVSVVQEAKMKMVRSRLAGKAPKLSTEDVLDVIADRRPSITKADLEEYQQFLHDYGERR